MKIVPEISLRHDLQYFLFISTPTIDIEPQNIIIVVKNEDNIFKKTGLRHIIVNCQLSIVNSAKPFKHQFVTQRR